MSNSITFIRLVFECTECPAKTSLAQVLQILWNLLALFLKRLQKVKCAIKPNRTATPRAMNENNKGVLMTGESGANTLISSSADSSELSAPSSDFLK